MAWRRASVSASGSTPSSRARVAFSASYWRSASARWPRRACASITARCIGSWRLSCANARLARSITPCQLRATRWAWRCVAVERRNSCARRSRSPVSQYLEIRRVEHAEAVEKRAAIELDRRRRKRLGGFLELGQVDPGRRGDRQVIVPRGQRIVAHQLAQRPQHVAEVLARGVRRRYGPEQVEQMVARLRHAPGGQIRQKRDRLAGGQHHRAVVAGERRAAEEA